MKNSESGQSIVEAVLLIALFLFVSRMTFEGLKNNEFLITLIQKPLVQIAATIENGSSHGSEQPRFEHPNSPDKHISYAGEEL